MNRKEAVALYDSGQWAQWTPYERVKHQLFEDRLIMPFEEFKRAAELVFGRPLSTTCLVEEFLKDEFLLLPVPIKSPVLLVAPKPKRRPRKS